MPSRRDHAKTDATRTPLADIAPALPARVEAAAKSDATLAIPDQRVPDDDMLPESTATMPVTPPETDTAPANVRSRPGARKVGDRTAIPVVPRTIAEMQTGVQGSNTVEIDAIEREERQVYVPEPQPLFIAPPTLVVTTFVPYAILALVPSLLDVIGRGAGFSNTARAITSFVMLAICGIGALLLLLRNWRVAFHDVPTELRPITILELWEQRASGVRRDGWVTGSLGIIAGFGVMLLLSLLLTVLSRGLTAIYAIPYLLILLFAKALGAVLFVGYLQRGLLSTLSATKATLATGLLYGVALTIWNVITIAASNVSDPMAYLISYTALSLAVALGAAWIRLRSGSVLAAVAFQLLLLLLGIAV